jgi:hypothetical protein
MTNYKTSITKPSRRTISSVPTIKLTCLPSVSFFMSDEEIDEEDIEGNKPLTMEEFRQKAFEKLEVIFYSLVNI